MSSSSHKGGTLAERTGELFSEGYCCSEAIVLACTAKYHPELPTETAKAVSSGFCGGIGDKQSTCGVITGAVLALGLVMDRGVKRDPAMKDLSAKLRREIYAEYGCERCHEILSKMGIMNWRARKCLKFTMRGAEILEQTLQQVLNANEFPAPQSSSREP